MRFSKRSALPAALVALTLVLAGCGGGDDKPKGEDSSSAKPTPEKPAVWPLTGLPVAEGQSDVLNHPPLVAKIPNNEHAAPQAGLSKADLVVEELVEGGTTRLAAFYYSQLPKSDVGPIRSMRASDIGIVSPVGGVMVTSGAAGQTIDRLNRAGVKFVQEGRAQGFRRDSSRPESVYSVMANLRAIAKNYGDKLEKAPAPYFTFGSDADLPQGEPAGTLSAGFGSRTSSWVFRGGKYVNTNGFAPKNDQFPADSVLVLRVSVVDAGYRDPAGNFVPESKFVGKGNAQLFHGGQVVAGTWSKAKPSSPLTLSTGSGELKVPAGKTWVELVPVNGKGGSVTYGK